MFEHIRSMKKRALPTTKNDPSLVDHDQDSPISKSPRPEHNPTDETPDSSTPWTETKDNANFERRRFRDRFFKSKPPITLHSNEEDNTYSDDEPCIERPRRRFMKSGMTSYEQCISRNAMGRRRLGPPIASTTIPVDIPMNDSPKKEWTTITQTHPISPPSSEQRHTISSLASVLKEVLESRPEIAVPRVKDDSVLGSGREHAVFTLEAGATIKMDVQHNEQNSAFTLDTVLSPSSPRHQSEMWTTNCASKINNTRRQKKNGILDTSSASSSDPSARSHGRRRLRLALMKDRVTNKYKHMSSRHLEDDGTVPVLGGDDTMSSHNSDVENVVTVSPNGDVDYMNDSVTKGGVPIVDLLVPRKSPLLGGVATSDGDRKVAKLEQHRNQLNDDSDADNSVSNSFLTVRDVDLTRKKSLEDTIPSAIFHEDEVEKDNVVDCIDDYNNPKDEGMAMDSSVENVEAGRLNQANNLLGGYTSRSSIKRTSFRSRNSLLASVPSINGNTCIDYNSRASRSLRNNRKADPSKANEATAALAATTFEKKLSDAIARIPLEFRDDNLQVQKKKRATLGLRKVLHIHQHGRVRFDLTRYCREYEVEEPEEMEEFSDNEKCDDDEEEEEDIEMEP